VPTPILPNYLVAVAIMSKAWCEAHNSTLPTNIATNEETYATRNENGTGPFMLKDRQPGVRTVLVKNPNWWGLLGCQRTSAAPSKSNRPTGVDS
jgi:peptide/nickel transport system substrate-binding protein